MFYGGVWEILMDLNCLERYVYLVKKLLNYVGLDEE